ncbi:hypothetical protein Hanom_Chr15g01364381 [Helianthus anomalus]
MSLRQKLFIVYIFTLCYFLHNLIFFSNEPLYMYKKNLKIRAEPSRADLCLCLARLQTEPTRLVGLQSSEKSSEHFPSESMSKLRALCSALLKSTLERPG